MSEAEIDAINLVPEAYRGMDRFEARAAVVADITAEGLAVMVPATDPRLGAGAASAGQAATGEPPLSPEEGGAPRTDADELVPLVEPKPIMQPHGDRSGTVIEPMLTDQWFVDTAQIVQPAIDVVRDGTIEIIPESDRKVYFHWLENIEPWCISRQLWWGHQVPVWYGPGVDGLGRVTGKFDFRSAERQRRMRSPRQRRSIVASPNSTPIARSWTMPPRHMTP